MGRKIIKIDEEKCVGCGLCARACKQSAIEIIGGKAKVTRDDYCDGLGNCLPVCPVNAISFSDRDVVNKNVAPVTQGCPGSIPQAINPVQSPSNLPPETGSALGQWPVQIKLVGETAPYFDGCNLLVAADCTAYAYGNFHSDFMKNKITLIGCPKLDMVDYTEKLTSILTHNNIKSLTVVRMEVPCCGGLERASVAALKASEKFIPWQIITISTRGAILDT